MSIGEQVVEQVLPMQFQPGGINTTTLSAFSYFNVAGGIEGNFGNGTRGSVLDFYKLEPAPNSPPAELVGDTATRATSSSS